MGDLTEHFSLWEFACRCGCGGEKNHEIGGHLIALCRDVLEPMRRQVGQVKVLSGYRCPAHNKAVGGKPASLHMQGRAADIVARSRSVAMLAAVAQAHAEAGPHIGGLGVYPGFVHVDNRPHAPGVVARW